MNGNHLATRDDAYFKRLYTANPDPWNFACSAYEQQKYAVTIDELGGRHFARGLEIGCSIGVLTSMLAGHCDALLGVDLVPEALAQAAARCAGASHVTFACMRVPQNWPAGQYDLIILSEILYFLHPADVARVAALTNASLIPAGVTLLVNYTQTIDEPCSGEEAADLFFRALPHAGVSRQYRCGDSFRIDLLVKDESPCRSAGKAE